MKRHTPVCEIVLICLFFLGGTAAEAQTKAGTVHLRIVNVSSGEDLGEATVKTFERAYGDVPSPNFADRFRENTALNIPYDFYRVCARTTAFWTSCKEVPVYQPEVWVVLGLRFGIAGVPGLSNFTGMVKNALQTNPSIWVRLMAVYSSFSADGKVSESGDFRLSGIPPGKYVLAIVQGNRVLHVRSVELPTSHAELIDLAPQK